MSKLSVVIPSSEDRWLAQTISSIFDNAAGDVEVIAVINGYTPTRPLPERPNLIYLDLPQPSMRAAINVGMARADGEWLMKTDEHCLFSPGFDETLERECADNWLLIPRRYSLDAEHWAIENNPKGPRDYHYLSCPVWSIRERDDYSMHGMEWPDRTRARLGNQRFEVDETMSWQGSCYFMARRHWERIGPLQEQHWGGFAGEPQELGLKTQLGGGRICVTKHAWYAHLHKGSRYGRGYRPDHAEIARGHEYNAWYWMTDQWPERAHDMRWLIEKWWPVPTWPDNTLEHWDRYFPKGATLEQLKAAALAKAVTHG